MCENRKVREENLYEGNSTILGDPFNLRTAFRLHVGNLGLREKQYWSCIRVGRGQHAVAFRLGKNIWQRRGAWALGHLSI